MTPWHACMVKACDKMPNMGLVTSQYLLAASGHMDAVNRGCRPYMFSMQGIIVVSKIVHFTNGLLMAEDGQGRHFGLRKTHANICFP